MSLQSFNGCTGSFPTLGYGLSGNTEKPTTILLSSSRDMVVARGSICTTFGWMIRRIVLYAVRDGEKEHESSEKEREPGDYSFGDAEVEGELSYNFLCNCRDIEQAGEESKKEESSKAEKHGSLKSTPPYEVIPKLWSCVVGGGETTLVPMFAAQLSVL